jgi:hypothetical protein
MTTAIEKAIEHYKATRDQRLHIPEWDLTVHWSIPNIEETKKLHTPHSDDETQGAVAVRVIIAKATDENGQKLFTIEHKPMLLKSADPLIISRLYTAIMGQRTIDKKDLEEAEKN